MGISTRADTFKNAILLHHYLCQILKSFLDFLKYIMKNWHP
jgi:hypothetical protein